MVQKTELKQMTRKQLAQLQKDIAEALEERKRETIQALRTKYRELAETEGLTFEEVIGSLRGKWRRGPVTVKYRDPNEPRNTWTGRGRKPRWLSAKLVGGKTLQDFVVAPLRT